LRESSDSLLWPTATLDDGGLILLDVGVLTSPVAHDLLSLSIALTDWCTSSHCSSRLIIRWHQ